MTKKITYLIALFICWNCSLVSSLQAQNLHAIAIGTTDCGSVEIVFDDAILNVDTGVSDADWGVFLFQVKFSTLENQVWLASQSSPLDPLTGADLGPVRFFINCGAFDESLNRMVYQINEADFWVERFEERGTTADGTPLMWEWAFSGFGGGIESYLLQEIEGIDEILVEETLINCELPPAPADCGLDPQGNAPQIVCPEDIEAGCDGEVALMVAVSDADAASDGPVLVSWAIDGELVDIQEVEAGVEPLPVDFSTQLAPGEHVIEVFAEDNDGEDACSFQVLVPSPQGNLSILTDAPETMLPKDAPLTFDVWLGDGQSGELVLGAPDCFKLKKDLSVVHKNDSCVVTVSGTSVSIQDAGGVGNHIIIPVTAIDACGHETTSEIIITVVRPANEGVGNGVDGDTPGHLHNGGNDDSAYGPGNPGARNKRR